MSRRTLTTRDPGPQHPVDRRVAQCSVRVLSDVPDFVGGEDDLALVCGGSLNLDVLYLAAAAADQAIARRAVLQNPVAMFITFASTATFASWTNWNPFPCPGERLPRRVFDCLFSLLRRRSQHQIGRLSRFPVAPCAELGRQADGLLRHLD
jgi:hypothetical protein